jgi:peptidoglycan L-alanyl-D-glutamate endopeptidase CwlK
MKDAAEQLGIQLEWGGDWKTFKDGPHFQLPWKDYPA